jgi:uncharacterized membrane protein required for colicin V production
MEPGGCPVFCVGVVSTACFFVAKLVCNARTLWFVVSVTLHVNPMQNKNKTDNNEQMQEGQLNKMKIKETRTPTNEKT